MSLSVNYRDNLIELFEQASHDLHVYNRLEQDIRNLFLPNCSALKSRE